MTTREDIFSRATMAPVCHKLTFGPVQPEYDPHEHTLPQLKNTLSSKAPVAKATLSCISIAMRNRQPYVTDRGNSQ